MSDKPDLGEMRMPDCEASDGTPYHQLHLNPKFHQMRHVHLHRSLDELVADFIRHNMKSKHDGRPICGLTNTSIMELMQWSYTQTQQPT